MPAMIRVALYARYSSDNQSVASIEDQFRICHEHALREHWNVVGTYQDAAFRGKRGPAFRHSVHRLPAGAPRTEQHLPWFWRAVAQVRTGPRRLGWRRGG